MESSGKRCWEGLLHSSFPQTSPGAWESLQISAVLDLARAGISASLPSGQCFLKQEVSGRDHIENS